MTGSETNERPRSSLRQQMALQTGKGVVTGGVAEATRNPERRRLVHQLARVRAPAEEAKLLVETSSA